MIDKEIHNGSKSIPPVHRTILLLVLRMGQMVAQNGHVFQKFLQLQQQDVAHGGMMFLVGIMELGDGKPVFTKMMLISNLVVRSLIQRQHFFGNQHLILYHNINPF